MIVDKKPFSGFIRKRCREFRDPSEDNNSFIFRGEAKKHEEVRSSLLRAYRKVLKSTESDVADIFESDLADQIIAREASPYFGGGVIRHGEYEALAILQHYGSPTSLMDFSKDWRVALYFACEKLEGKDGRIIYFSQERAERCYQLKVREPEGHQHDNSGRPVGREIEQRSVLVSAESGKFIPEQSDTKKVPRELKAGLLAWLREEGIHRESVYRDAHGFVSLMDEEVWRSLHVAECAIELCKFDVAETVLANITDKIGQMGIEQKGKAYLHLGRASESQGELKEALPSYKESCRLLLHNDTGIAPRVALRRCSRKLGFDDLADEAVNSIETLWGYSSYAQCLSKSDL